MKRIVLYQTIDGKIFTDEKEATIHERKNLVLPESIKEPPHRSGVYRWICKPEGKIYTGKAVDLNLRFWEFIDALRYGTRYAGDKLHIELGKYPTLDSWEYSVLKYVDDKSSLNESEKEKIQEIPKDKTLNTQYAWPNKNSWKSRFVGSTSSLKLTDAEYQKIDIENKFLGKKHGFTFRLNWSLMNLSLGKHEISVDTVRHIPTEIGNAITFSVSNSTCYKQVSDIGDRPKGYYAKVVHKGKLTTIGPFNNIEDCKKRYLEEKVSIIKQVIPKYKDVMEKDVFDVLEKLTTEDAGKLSSLR